MVLQLDPSHPDPLVTLGLYYARQDLHPKADDYRRAVQTSGLESVDLYNNWAVSSFSLEMVDQAMNSQRYSRQLDPEHPESHCNLGIAYSSEGNTCRDAARNECSHEATTQSPAEKAAAILNKATNYFFATFLFNSSIKSIIT